MYQSIRLDNGQRRTLLDHYRRDPDPEVRRRAHILLLLADGYAWAFIGAVLYCSSRTIARWKTRFERDGTEAVLGRRSGRRPSWGIEWVRVAAAWVLEKVPSDFGFLRSRWSCSTLVVLLMEVHQIYTSRETVRRWLHRDGLVWRRPRPVLGKTDPHREAVLRGLKALLATMPEDETAVFTDEVDINTNPKIGSMWMRKGEQAEVETPGDNEKRLLCGSIHWRTGRVLVTEGRPKEGRTTALFLRHLDHLRSSLRHYRTVHVICDNAISHRSKAVWKYLAEWGHRVVLHFLPKRAPDANPVERVWWHLHDEITRNHRCKNMEELLEFTFAWLSERNPFTLEGSLYPSAKAAA